MVFTTGMNGYQEAVTDPSYLGQILAFSAPMIGNYGTGPHCLESDRVWPGAVIATRIGDSPGVSGPVGFRTWLRDQGVLAVEDADTRRLVRHLRDHGAMRGGVSTEKGAEELLAMVREHPSLDGRDLASAAAGERRTRGDDGPRIVAVDCGMKEGILNGLADAGMRVEVVPAGITAAEVLAMGPDGVFISNGPGDPAAVTPVIGLRLAPSQMHLQATGAHRAPHRIHQAFVTDKTHRLAGLPTVRINITQRRRQHWGGCAERSLDQIGVKGQQAQTVAGRALGEDGQHIARMQDLNHVVHHPHGVAPR
jgi:hypothetical protein